jgi:hypothetical protein
MFAMRELVVVIMPRTKVKDADHEDPALERSGQERPEEACDLPAPVSRRPPD